MLKNFFLVALRNISRNKVFTFINVTGLAIGMTASLLILLWIQDEISYEKYNENARDIYRVEQDQFYSGERYHVNVTPHPSGPVWKERIPEIKEQTRINRLPRLLFRLDEMAFYETNVIAADSGLFKMFTFPLILGDPERVLGSPHSIVLTKKLAEKYFGDSNPVGKTIIIENKMSFMVSGVMKDLPRNSTFTFEAVIPYSFLREIGAISDSWGSNSILTFVQLENGSVTDSVNKKLTDVVLEYQPQTVTKYMVSPLLDIHLHSQFGYSQNNGPVLAIIIFTIVAVFILLIACFNFINLSTARASSRAKEIGIKKVTGADRRTLITQFMFESLLLVVIALLIALILMGLLLDTFNNISGKRFILSDLFQLKYISGIVIVGMVAGFVSGIYPALYLSAFKPVSVIKGDITSGQGHGYLRKILVVIQFTLSILIAVVSTFMFMQLRFLQEKDLGFDKENLLCIAITDNIKGKYYSLKTELLKETLIRGVTASTRNPVMIGSNSGGASWDGKDPEKRVLIGTNGIDYDYLETMKMTLISGRNFSKEYPGDLARDTTGNFLINEEVAKIMNIGDPVGQNFRFMGLRGKIVGVMKNFNFKGADQPIEPIAFALGDVRFLNNILIRLAPGKIPESLKTVETVWNEIIPEYPLQYSFIDEDYDNIFRTQTRMTRLLGSFTMLAIIIACLGLYGLSSFSTQRRTNEVGIRKVMGAGAGIIVAAMTKEFLFLVLISIVLALPAGYYVVLKLLKQFALRIEISPLVFAAIAAGAIMIAFITVSFQALRATHINPAEALRVEK